MTVPGEICDYNPLARRWSPVPRCACDIMKTWYVAESSGKSKATRVMSVDCSEAACYVRCIADDVDASGIVASMGSSADDAVDSGEVGRSELTVGDWSECCG